MYSLPFDIKSKILLKFSYGNVVPGPRLQIGFFQGTSIILMYNKNKHERKCSLNLLHVHLRRQLVEILYNHVYTYRFIYQYDKQVYIF
jgi:hypothetical protein